MPEATETTAPTTTAPAGTTEPTETPDLGDAGKKAIAAERKRADAHDKELKALKAEAQSKADAELSELERFKKENDELRSGKTAADLQALRLEVALEKGLPANLAARLQGSDRESLETDADSLSELVASKPNGQVRSDPSQGAKPGTGSQDPGQAFADALNRARGRTP